MPGYGDQLLRYVLDHFDAQRAVQGPWVEQICDRCARALGGQPRGCSTYNATNPCDVCERTGVSVTEPRDWQLDLTVAEARRRLQAIEAKVDECEGV